jgi:hypothetical protein
MFAKVDKNLNSCESLGINKVNACSNWSARRRKTIVKFDSHGDWREDIFYNGRNGNYRKINGKGYVFRIK